MPTLWGHAKVFDTRVCTSVRSVRERHGDLAPSKRPHDPRAPVHLFLMLSIITACACGPSGAYHESLPRFVTSSFTHAATLTTAGWTPGSATTEWR